MTKRSKKSKTQPTIVVIITLIIAVITALQQSRQQTSTTTPVATGGVTQIVSKTATPAPKTKVPAATVSSSTSVPLQTRKPVATDVPGLQVTPINGVIYDVTGSTNALGCPNSRCKVIEAYTKDNILIVTGSVIGTTYKDKKTRVWYQVIAHDGRKVYVHEAFVKPHES
jgi:hypothetical protein